MEAVLKTEFAHPVFQIRAAHPVAHEDESHPVWHIRDQRGRLDEMAEALFRS